MKWSVCAAGLALVTATVGQSFADGRGEATLLDLYRAGCNEQLFRDHPDAVSFATIGDVHGRRYTRLMDEVFNTFSTLDSMLAEAGLAGQDLQEIRISTISASDLKEVQRTLDLDERFDALPITFEIVESLPVSWARIGLYAVGEKAGVSAQLIQRFGSTSPTSSGAQRCTGSWTIGGQ